MRGAGFIKYGLLTIGLISACFTLLSCVGNRSRLRNPASTVKAPTNSLPAEVLSDPQYLAAQEFDQWLQGRLSPQSSSVLNSKCRSHPTSSPFCFSVLNREELESRAKKAIVPQKKTSKRTLVAKFKNGKVSNWLDLRFSPVMASLRGLTRVKPSEIELLRMKALQEDHCPNNIATALAAFLEDELPNNISLEKLAELYQKGGTCPTEDPNDAETLSTRAGLMFFAAKQWDKAEVCFQNSNQLKKAFRSRALYWLSRVHEEKGNRSAAKKDIQELKHSYPFAFHTLMALTSRDEDPGEVLERNEPSLLTRSQQAPQLNNLTEQVELLTQFGLLQAADKVLTWIISDSQNAEPEFMLYLSDLRESHGNQLGRLTILSNMLYANPAFTSKSVMERYFPKIYFPIFEKYSQGLDPYLLMALARRESAFNPKAVSRAKAKGLMQIAPHTQRKLTSLKNIFNPEDNISLGSRYFSELIQRTNGQIHLALASYNAGPNRVEIWSSRYPMSDPILFMDLIPYRETREYVASVLRNYYWYRRLHTDRSPSSVEQLIKTTP